MKAAPITRQGTPEHSERIKRERTASWGRVKAGEGFIYAATDKTGEIKIGFSLNPAWRVYELGLTLLAQVPGTHRQEIELHKALREQMPRRGETYPRSILNHPAIPAELRAAA